MGRFEHMDYPTFDLSTSTSLNSYLFLACRLQQSAILSLR
jgi:hypothetical protein